MTNKYWEKLKVVSEAKFENVVLEECYGYQIQSGTQWNEGLSDGQIKSLEEKFGFDFPADYVDMLKVMNGFDTKQIYIDPKGEHEDEFERRCYKYPDDLANVQWLIEEVNEYIECANQVLSATGFNPAEIEGFVPLYAHRALVVFKDKSLSPVLSIWRSDIIIYGESLKEYWKSEFYLEEL